MAIIRPVTKTIISSSSWGIPITDEVNRLTPLVDGAKPTAWTNCTLTNGWTVQDGMTPRYRKIGDVVQVTGRCGGGSPGTAMFNLPTGYRHPTGVAWTTGGFNGTAWDMCLLDIQTGGNFVHAQGGLIKITITVWYPTS